jgi:hypothetical protein
MMLSKEMVCIFSVPTLESMKKDLEFHREEIKNDPQEPKYLARMLTLIQTITYVIRDKS